MSFPRSFLSAWPSAGSWPQVTGSKDLERACPSFSSPTRRRRTAVAVARRRVPDWGFIGESPKRQIKEGLSHSIRHKGWLVPRRGPPRLSIFTWSSATWRVLRVLKFVAPPNGSFWAQNPQNKISTAWAPAPRHGTRQMSLCPGARLLSLKLFEFPSRGGL